jgi:hypothetical protein
MYHYHGDQQELRLERLKHEGVRRDQKTNPFTEHDKNAMYKRKKKIRTKKYRAAYDDKYAEHFNGKLFGRNDGSKWSEAWQPTKNQLRNGKPGKPKHRFRPGARYHAPRKPKLYHDLLKAAIPAGSIPSYFDCRENWQSIGLGSEDLIFQQGVCGDCYIFASTECMQQRLAITLGKSIPRLGQLFVLEQSPYQKNYFQKCDGGDIEHVCDWLTQNEIVEDAYMPYDNWKWANVSEDPNQVKLPSSYAKKSAGIKIPSDVVRWKATGSYTVADGKSDDPPSAIQRDIMSNGPVVAYMDEYDDFQESFYWDPSKNTGVYKPGSNAKIVGGHAILIVGWGVDGTNGTPYWLIQNSWGTINGTTGYFKILRGSNCCNIETEVVAIDFSSDDAKSQDQENQNRIPGNGNGNENNDNYNFKKVTLKPNWWWYIIAIVIALVLVFMIFDVLKTAKKA